MKFFENETQVINVVDNILKADSADDDIHMVRPHGRKVFRFPKWYDRHGVEYINCSSIEIEHDGKHRHLVWPYSPDAEIKLVFENGQVKIVSMRNVKNLALFCSDQKTLMKTWTARTMPGQEPIERHFNLLCGSSDDPGIDPGPEPGPDPDPLPDACPPEDIHTPRKRWSYMISGIPHHQFKAEYLFNNVQNPIPDLTESALVAADGHYIEFTPNPPIPLDSNVADNIRLYLIRSTAKNNTSQLFINGIQPSNSLPENADIPCVGLEMFVPTFNTDIGSEIVSIKYTNPSSFNNIYMGGIWINGKELVDDNVLLDCQNGDCSPDDVYKPRQDFTSMGEGETWPDAYHPIDYAFDGVLDQKNTAIPGRDKSIIWTANPPIALDPSIPNNIQFHMAKAAQNPLPGRERLFVNGVAMEETGIPWMNSGYVTVNPVFKGDIGNTLYTIEWNSTAHGNNPKHDHTNIAAIYVNGKMLVDLDIDYGC